MAHHGRDRIAQYRRELEKRLMSMIQEARQNAGLDLYLPLGRREANLPASFLVSSAEFTAQGTPRPEDVLARVLAETPDARPTELDGTPAIRSERTWEPDASRGIDYASRRVEYILPVPGAGRRWLVAAFSTFGDGDPDGRTAVLLCALFDAIMATFRWTSTGETV